MAAVRRRRVRAHDRRRRRARRARAVPRRAAARRRTSTKSYGQPRVSARGRHALRALRPRDRQGHHRGRARPAAHRHRRLERRHEPRRAGRARREHLARLLPPPRAQRLRAALPRRGGDRARADRYRERGAPPRRRRLEQSWDGEWYRRGYYDDGTPLGSAQNDECSIDSIAQSWAVLSGAVPLRFAERAMDAVRTSLIARGSQILLLLDPPFDSSAQDPGYIKGYPPGVRENGGQYTHAAVWIVMALARLGSGDEAAELFHMLNPINHTPHGRRRRALQDRAVRDRRRRLRAAAARRTRRLELVHGIGRLDVSRRPREHPRPAPARRHVRHRPVHSHRRGPSTGSRGASATAATRSRSRIPTRRCRGVATATLDGAPVDAAAIPLVDDGRTHDVQIVLGDPPPRSIPFAVQCRAGLQACRYGGGGSKRTHPTSIGSDPYGILCRPGPFRPGVIAQQRQDHVA